MIEWLSNNAGLTGLLFFFSVFSGVAIWAFRPSARHTIEAHKFIPLEPSYQKSDQMAEDDT
ncbi:MAG: cbb3-type cytochrome c oxidase subunit 3 [Kordiimonadaceae bacterium]|nr:cbb3-type cytochrome c oxidase subunit 3 [Kordiimonadaceae bacterium]